MVNYLSKKMTKRYEELQGLIEGKQVVVDSLVKKRTLTLDRLNALLEASKNKSDKEIERVQSKLDKLKREYEEISKMRQMALEQLATSNQNEYISEKHQGVRDETYSVGSC